MPGSDKPLVRYAFFTEHFDDMAARHSSTPLYEKGFDHDLVDLQTFDQLALYHFMIGNTDWSVVRERNVILTVTEDGRQYPVPYDLDMSGLVNAEYAGVSPRLDFRDPRKRYYLGFCHPDVDFQGEFEKFRALEQDLIALVDDVPGMNSKGAKQSRKYLNKFFKLLQPSESRREKIIDACHPWPPSPDDHTTPPE